MASNNWLTLKQLITEEKERIRHRTSEEFHIKKGALCQILSWMKTLESGSFKEYHGN